MDTENTDPKEKQTIIVQQQVNRSNTMGTLGLIFAILSWPLSCFPIFGGLLWILGLVFSILGLFKRPRGAAIAGLIISCLGLILIVLMVIGILGYANFSEMIPELN